jgi:hypothetical protein
MTSFAIKPTKPVKPTKFETTVTQRGTWRKCDLGGGQKFCEFKSHAEVGDQPLVTIAWGIDPDTRKMATAEGFIAIGQRAKGVIAIGQFVNGHFAFGQFAVARVAAIGQFVVAPLAAGQFAIAVATVAQSGLAGWGILQIGTTVFGGLGQFVFSCMG